MTDIRKQSKPTQDVTINLKVLSEDCPVCSSVLVAAGSYNDLNNLPNTNATVFTEEVRYNCGSKLTLRRKTGDTEETINALVDDLLLGTPCPDQGKALLQQIKSK